MSIELQPAPAVLRMTVEVKRAATGKTETYELIGTPIEHQPEKEQDHERDASDSLS